jgi:hypothetical protein
VFSCLNFARNNSHLYRDSARRSDSEGNLILALIAILARLLTFLFHFELYQSIFAGALLMLTVFLGMPISSPEISQGFRLCWLRPRTGWDLWGQS